MPGLRSLLSRFLVSCLLLAANPAFAGQVQFGARTLDIPDPPGFVPASQDLPFLIEATQAYLPATNRLAEVFVLPADRDALKAGQQKILERYFQVQVMRPLEGVAISPADFEGLRGQLREGVLAQAPRVDPSESVRKGNAAMKDSGSDVQMSISGIGFKGIFRDEATGLYFTSTAEVGIDEADASRKLSMTGSTAIVLVDRQVLFLYAFAVGDDAAAQRLTESSVSAWADAVRRANPGVASN